MATPASGFSRPGPAYPLQWPPPWRGPLPAKRGDGLTKLARIGRELIGGYAGRRARGPGKHSLPRWGPPGSPSTPARPGSPVAGSFKGKACGRALLVRGSDFPGYPHGWVRPWPWGTDAGRRAGRRCGGLAEPWFNFFSPAMVWAGWTEKRRAALDDPRAARPWLKTGWLPSAIQGIIIPIAVRSGAYNPRFAAPGNGQGTVRQLNDQIRPRVRLGFPNPALDTELRRIIHVLALVLDDFEFTCGWSSHGVTPR